jgi:hypothetical protein
MDTPRKRMEFEQRTRVSGTDYNRVYAQVISDYVLAIVLVKMIRANSFLTNLKMYVCRCEW